MYTNECGGLNNEPSLTRGRLCLYAIKSVLLKEQNEQQMKKTIMDIFGTLHV